LLSFPIFPTPSIFPFFEQRQLSYQLFRCPSVPLSSARFPFNFLGWLLYFRSAHAQLICALFTAALSFNQPFNRLFNRSLCLFAPRFCSISMPFRFFSRKAVNFHRTFVLALLFLLLLLFVSCGLLLLCATGSLCPLFLVPLAPPPFPRLLCFHCLCFELLCCCFPCCHFALFFLLARSPCIFIFICGLFSTAYANTRGFSTAKYYEFLIPSKN